jgi:hypothetical protein
MRPRYDSFLQSELNCAFGHSTRDRWCPILNVAQGVGAFRATRLAAIQMDWADRFSPQEDSHITQLRRAGA